MTMLTMIGYLLHQVLLQEHLWPGLVVFIIRGQLRLPQREALLQALMLQQRLQT